MKYILTLKFDLEVETGDKDINEIEKTVAKSFSGYIGEKVTVVNTVKKEEE